jgi:hypothetical protein
MFNGLQVAAVLTVATSAGCSTPIESRSSGSQAPYGIGTDDDQSSHQTGPSRSLTIRCESDHGRRRHCDIDASGTILLSRRLSSTPCVQGRNWDIDQTGVWVAAGCRAEFTREGGRSPGMGHANGTLVRCESDDGHLRRCEAPIVRGVELRRNVSHTPCVRGENWGWDARSVWVDNGCRGEFEVF